MDLFGQEPPTLTEEGSMTDTADDFSCSPSISMQGCNTLTIYCFTQLSNNSGGFKGELFFFESADYISTPNCTRGHGVMFRTSTQKCQRLIRLRPPTSLIENESYQRFCVLWAEHLRLKRIILYLSISVCRRSEWLRASVSQA